MSLRGVAEDLHGAERVATVWYADSGEQLLTRRVVRMAAGACRTGLARHCGCTAGGRLTKRCARFCGSPPLRGGR